MVESQAYGISPIVEHLESRQLSGYQPTIAPLPSAGEFSGAIAQGVTRMVGAIGYWRGVTQMDRAREDWITDSITSTGRNLKIQQ
jgi:hypothetical protein